MRTSLLVLALATGAAAGKNRWVVPKVSTTATVQDCKLKGSLVKGLNLASNFEWDLSDETTVSVEYDHSNSAMPSEVNIKHEAGNVGVDCNLDLEAKSATAEVSVSLEGGTSATLNLDTEHARLLKEVSVEHSYALPNSHNSVVLTPSWTSAKHDEVHVRANLNLNAATKAELEVDLCEDPSASMKVDYALNDHNTFSPNVNLRSGDLSYEYTRTLGDDSEVVASFEPSKEINVEWKESSWTTSVNIPWGNAADSSVEFKRSIDW